METKSRYGLHKIINTVTREIKTFSSQKEMKEFLKKPAKSLIQFKLRKKDIDNWRYVGIVRLPRSEVSKFWKNI